jgi:hypothetical protein
MMDTLQMSVIRSNKSIYDDQAEDKMHTISGTKEKK